MTDLDAKSLLRTLEERFATNMHRQKGNRGGIRWTDVRARLDASPHAMVALRRMEETGGAPNVVWRDRASGAITFVDCSPETPLRRRSLCYDGAALASRKEHKPRGSAVEDAADMGVELLTEAEYRSLQELGEFDTKTSSWIATPPEIRDLGGALFCDRRYRRVFVYHNGAESYFASRGYRGALRV
jgi:hypothetical protein